MSRRETGKTPQIKDDFYKLKLITAKSKEEFMKEFKRYDESSLKEFYLQVLTELKNTIEEGDIKRFKCFSRTIDNLSVENEKLLKHFFDDIRNPFKKTNLVILACKHNQVKLLKHVFKYDNKILKNLSIHREKNGSPIDEDETCHNAFYYAIRSNNVELFKALIDWPDKCFDVHKYKLDEVISKACAELKLKNVSLTEEMETSIEEILIKLHFSADDLKSKQSVNNFDNIYKRIQLVLDNINLLKEKDLDAEVDETFLFVVKFIAQNVHILKRLLKSTYDRLPWEELEFILFCFVSSCTKLQEINLFYDAALDKSNLLHYLQVFAQRLEDVRGTINRVSIGKLAILPQLTRETVVAQIISCEPEFKELYKSYEQIRDIHSLQKIYNCVKLARTVDPEEREGQLVIIRVLQLIGEYLKNTLESPNLSDFTSELLLLSLSRHTRKVITGLRNSLSHASSLFKRREIEKDSDANFFIGVQSDIKKIGNAIIDILYNSKLKVIRSLLKRIVDSENFNEIKKIVKILRNCKYEEVTLDYSETSEHNTIEKLINELHNKITDKTDLEIKLFNEIDKKMNFTKKRSEIIPDDYGIGFLMLKGFEDTLANRIDDNAIRAVKFHANQTLQNIVTDKESQNLKEIGELSAKIFNSVKSRKYEENLDEIVMLIGEIFFIAEIRKGDIKWIEEFRGKLKNEESSSSSILRQKKADILSERDINAQLAAKMSELKSIFINNISSDDAIKDICSYKNDKKLQAIIEMLLLDIMSILNISNCLENNIFFLDADYPLLSGKCLRNHLAHDNSLFDVLLTSPSTTIILIAKKITEEDVVTINKSKRKILTDDPDKLREKYNLNLKMIDNQRRMYNALEEGDLEILKDCVEKGADVNAISTNSWTSLHFAAKGSSLEVIKFILELNVQVNVKDNDGNNPLHIAAAYGNTNIVEYLIKETSLSVRDVDENQKTPLHIATLKGHKDTVEFLLKNNADYSAKDRSGISPIHYAITNNHVDIVKILLEKGSNVDINVINDGCTSLHKAAAFGYLEVLIFLLENGADVNAKTDRNWTLLHFASINGQLDVVKTLILKGADINGTDIGGFTSLHYALESGHVEVANILLSYGAKVNVSDKTYKDSSLHYATRNGHESIVRALLKHGADANVTNIYGLTPLHLAAQNGYLEIVTALLEHGVDINAKGISNNTPLHHAAENGHHEVSALLIKNGAAIDAKADKDFTPLHLAALNGHKDVVNLLLKNNAKANGRDAAGNTILHVATVNGSRDIIGILIEHGAQINVENKVGVTPLHTAAINGSEDAVVFLVENGAKVNVQDVNHVTPLHAAISAGHKNIVEFLIKNEANVNSKVAEGHTSIHLAIEAGHREIVEVLIANGADVNAKGKDNFFTPLYTAVKYNRKDIAKVLIENGAIVNEKACAPLSLAIMIGYKDIVEILIENKADINTGNDENFSMLHLAAKRGQREVVKLLLEKGANVNGKTVNNVTPLFFAAKNGHEEVVELLIANGAILNIVSNEGLAPLHAAIANGHDKVIKILLEYGASITIENDKGLPSPLDFAVLSGQLAAVKVLLQHKKENLNAKGSENCTILHLAAQENNLEIIKYLVSEGADINSKNAFGSKSIHIAAREGFKDAIEYFLSIGCSVNELSSVNQTPLHYATIKDNSKIVKYLIAQGANVNAKDEIGTSPLHIAATFGHKNAIEVLLKNGAVYDAVDNFNRKPSDMTTERNIVEYFMSIKKIFEAVKSNNVSIVKKYINSGIIIDVKNSDGMTPLHFAAWKGNEEVLNILLQNNANPNIAGNKKITPLHYAAKFSHLKIVKALLSHGAVFNAVSESGKTPSDLCVEESITSLFKLVCDSFKNVKNNNAKFINHLKRIKDIDTIKAIMNARNAEHETLIVAAMHNNFSETEQLKAILEDGASDTVQMALLLADRGDYQSALSICNDVYERRKCILGPNNPSTLEIERHIATILYKQGYYVEALCKLERIHQKQKEILGLNNKETLSTKSMIALIFHRQERHEEALKIFQEVLPKQKEIFGSNHSNDVLSTRFHMAAALNALGKHEEALTIYRSIYEDSKRRLGADDPITIRAQNNVALVLGCQGDYEQSIKIYKNVLERKKRKLGLYHIDTLRTLQSIPGLYAQQNKSHEALIAYQEVLDTQKTVLGPDNPETLKTMFLMANFFFEQQKYANALKFFTECSEKFNAVFGPNNQFILDIAKKIEIIKFRFKLEGSNPSDILRHMQEDIKTGIKNGDVQAVLHFLNAGTDVNEKDSDGATLLHFAVSFEQKDIVNLLIKHGANIFQVTNKCNTPLHIATSKKNQEIVHILLQYVPRDKLNGFVNTKTKSGKTTALHVAAKNGSLDIVKILLKHGAIYDIENNDGNKPLNLSNDQRVSSLLMLIEELFHNTKNGNAVVIKRLVALERDEFLNVMNARNHQGNTLLQVAITSKHLKIASKLSEMLKNKGKDNLKKV